MTLHSAADSMGTASIPKIFANIFISFIGAGILGLPYAFKTAGLAEGVLVFTVVAALSVKAMLLLVDCKYELLAQLRRRRSSESLLENGDAERSTESQNSLDFGTLDHHSVRTLLTTQNVTYADVGFFACGYRGRQVVEIAILISQIGFCCAYLIFISENLSSYVPSVRSSFWLVLMLPILYALTLYRELHRLAFFSLFAQVSNIFAFIVVFWFDFEHIHEVKKRMKESRDLRLHPKEFSLSGFPFFFAIAIYCFEGAGMILSLEMSLVESIRHKFRTYFVATIVCVTSLYIAFGCAGYLSFGPHTRSIITLNLPHGGGVDFVMLVKMSLCLALFFTYPVMMFPVSELLDARLLHRDGADAHTYKPNAIRLCLVLLTGMIVLLVPSFADLMSLIGATCCTMLGFVLPALFHLRLHRASLTPRQRYLDYALIAIGIIGSLIGTADTVQRMYFTAPSSVVAPVPKPAPSSHIRPKQPVPTQTKTTLSSVLSGLTPAHSNDSKTVVL